jgi:DNA-binding transcriptional LysR family regulator
MTVPSNQPRRDENRSMYNLKAIQIFVVVAETRSFRKAAEMLHRSQSAVSTQIKLLEEQIGVALFHRTTRRVELTHEGEQLLSHAQRAIASLEQGLKQIREAANLQVGHIAMGCVPSVASTILPSVLAEFQHKRGNIRLELRELPSMQLLEAVSRQEIAFAIAPQMEQAGDFDFAPFASEPIYALLPRAFAKPGAKSITLAELAELPVVLASGAAALRKMLNEQLGRHGLEITKAFEVIQGQTMIAFAQVGLGAAVLPRLMLPKPLDASLQALPIVEPTLARSLCLVTLKGNSLSPAALELSKLIVERFRDAMVNTPG